jgi:nitrogen fixation NifU-like protein
MNKELIIQRYKQPKYFNENISSNGSSINSACGDEIYVQSNVENGVVKALEYKGTGCSICLATTDLMIDMCLGKSIDEVLKIDEQTALGLIDMNVDSARKRCGTLGIEAIKNSLIDVE